MKYVALFFSCLMSCTNIPSPEVASPPPMRMPIALGNDEGTAHACPVDGKVVTAKHVAYRKVLSFGVLAYVPEQYIAEDAFGQLGVAKPITYNLVTDLALLQLSFEVREYHKRGLLPKEGDRMRWVEYDFTARRKAYASRERNAKVLRTRLGMIILDEEPTSGASGTCLFNEFDEVVGIIAWGQVMPDGMIGGAIDLSTLP